jgi:hypothetical protein
MSRIFKRIFDIIQQEIEFLSYTGMGKCTRVKIFGLQLRGVEIGADGTGRS